jgi:hypothetical protein
LQDDELRPFLSHLAGKIASPLAAARFHALWESEAQLAALRQRYGGYVSDLVELRDAHNNSARAARVSAHTTGARAAAQPGTMRAAPG